MSTGKTRLLLIRHGQTPWNAAGRWQGHADPGLTEAGHRQAETVALALAGEAERPWSAVFCSDLARARQTAARIAEALALPLEQDVRLRELDVGAWSGRTRAEIEQADADALRAFDRGEPDVRAGGGESRVDIRTRAHAFARSLLERRAGESLIVVTHLGVIRALVPGAEPTNAARIEAVAEEVVARGIDRFRRPEDGVL